MKVRDCNDYYLSDKGIALTRYKEPQRTTFRWYQNVKLFVLRTSNPTSQNKITNQRIESYTDRFLIHGNSYSCIHDLIHTASSRVQSSMMCLFHNNFAFIVVYCFVVARITDLYVFTKHYN